MMLETKRLIMRPFQIEDAPSLFKLNSDPDVMKYTGDIYFKSIEETREKISEYDQYKKYKMGRFSTIRKKDGAYLGWCGLKLGEDNLVDLGYRFMKEYWGLGYATESSQASLKYGFMDLQIDEIVARAMPENTASIKVMEKLGMHHRGQYYDEGILVELYFLSRDEYVSKYIQ
ncbi:MAG: GNAT family N-acetyltransferase [Bacteroidia bacterium]|nr:GNAT family N-acetyltransferase [Bacteroidia bacterium]